MEKYLRVFSTIIIRGGERKPVAFAARSSSREWGVAWEGKELGFKVVLFRGEQEETQRRRGSGEQNVADTSRVSQGLAVVAILMIHNNSWEMDHGIVSQGN